MNNNQKHVIFGEGNLSIEDIVALAERRALPHLSVSDAFTSRIQAGATFLDRELNDHGHIYGVTTGYGDSVSRRVPPELVDELPLHLSRFHGCGLGNILKPDQAHAVLAVRLASLCTGYSGVSTGLLKQLSALLENDIVPLIPEEGSVGASGDLTPLSYVAAALVGERNVLFDGTEMPATDALSKVGLSSLRLRPKEALAIMNGTSVMTALMCQAFVRAQYLCELSTRITSLASIGLLGNPAHFDNRLFAAKPHPKQAIVAARISNDLAALGPTYQPARLQDRYSLRCAPHVIGVLADMMPTFRTILETELNSANDNPLIDVDAEEILHGGHFYGGHIAFVADGMKTLVANLADLMDRQMALLVDTKFNHGLPSNLSGSSSDRASINHGLKAVQIGVSAWTAEALKNTMPASVFSRSTECHNQDKVSMGTIAARDCLRVLELTEQVAAGLLVTVRQAISLRLQTGEIQSGQLGSDLAAFCAALEADIPFIDEDQPLEATLRQLLVRIQSRHWTLYDDEEA
ncbi:aromatic amino acid lyase [Thalassospira tepidiphila]|jgi:histidine ammonia-lyase|uniref:HAL/PAL/TAL family ammonia-lyase n=1 Tax=Thalassospira tepidiphila TaxID=393657 RepID=UPI001BD0D714|nr:aromatic amino acid ammonia-lyase [Thalassospira tepidiphila]MBS8272798.1 aromatic amino acid lyase [Thalassospira tepidiphila]